MGDLLRRTYRRSTWVIFTFVLAVFVLVNLPGRSRFSPSVFSDGKYGPHFELFEYFEHGWPWVFLRREGMPFNYPASRQMWFWDVFEDIERFNALSLVLNVLIALATSFAAALLFERWRQSRRRILQFHVRDLLILASVVAAATAFFAYHQAEFTAEKHALLAIENTADPKFHWNGTLSDRIEWHPGGPTWLREILGDWPFKPFDRVVEVETCGAELKHVSKLRHVKVVRLMYASNRELKWLEDLPQLEALDMCGASVDEKGQVVVDAEGYEEEQYFQLPRLPKLRGLNLYDAGFRGEGLENIPSIEMLDLSGTAVKDDLIPALSKLTSLKVLDVYDTDISDSGIVQLRKALPDCYIRR